MITRRDAVLVMLLVEMQLNKVMDAVCFFSLFMKNIVLSERMVMRSLVRNGKRSGSRGAVVLEGESV